MDFITTVNSMHTTSSRCRPFVALTVSLILAACGGGDTPPTPPVDSGIGAAGGTVTGPSGAKVVIPAGALAAATNIAVSQSSTGAPALPAGLIAAGQMFAFTPHGTTFASPVTITVPFDPALVPAGSEAHLYKTNGTLTSWAEVAGAITQTTGGSSTMSGQVSGFSLAQVVAVPLEEHPELVEKHWTLRAFPAESLSQPAPIEDVTQVGGEVHRQLPVGGTLFFKPASQPFPQAAVEVLSSENGKKFYTLVQAPAVTEEESADTTSSKLTQTYTFKRPPGAVPSLKFVISRALLETVDEGGAAPSLRSCPWLDATLSEDDLEAACFMYMMRTQIRFTLRATRRLAPDSFFSTAGLAGLYGAGTHWRFRFTWIPDFENQVWTSDNFTFTGNVGASAGRHASVELAAPITVTVPVAGNVGDNEEFTVEIGLFSMAENRVQGESYAAAMIRDPLESSGIAVEFSGLEQVAVQHPVLAPEAKPCTTGTDALAGTVRFASGPFEAPERSEDAEVVVERVGGTKGEASVMLDSIDDSALAGSDYLPVHQLVRFGDGQAGDRTVVIPLVLDDVEEPNKTVKFKLTPFIGCEAVDTTQASLLIQDDDGPPPVPPNFSLGGSVSGLSGSGLRLTTALGDSVQPTSNGPFTFAVKLDDGATYAVSVAQQPANPAQICSVSNGSGTVTGANVTNVLVSCVSPQPSGALDAFFGAQGKVSDTSRAVTAIALQPDGKLLTIGGMTLSRFNTNGTLDTGFGNAGRVELVADGSATDAAHALAVQADGLILVAGTTGQATVPGNRLFMQRFNADGSLDSSFGTDGKVFGDATTLISDARTLLVQPDGKIAIAATASVGPVTLADLDFAVVRFMPDGTLDQNFGFHGTATQNFGGHSEFVNAAALQEDGSIVVVGRVFTDNGTGDSDFGLLRFLSNGTLDTTFGPGGGGLIRVDFGKGGVVPLNFDGGGWDEATDVTIQSDGKIVVSGNTAVGTGFNAAVLRLSSTGFVDANFGTLGLVISPLLDGGNGVALQSDGKIVLAGRGSSDFGIVRLTTAGVIDDAFGTQGVVRVDFFGGTDTANDVAIQSDGRIVVAGSERNGTTFLGIARALP